MDKQTLSSKKEILKGMQISKLESMLKGLSHKTRLEILFFLHENPDSPLHDIQNFINSTQQNTSNHITKMLYGGLILKMQKGNKVLHKLSKKGKKVVEFLFEI